MIRSVTTLMFGLLVAVLIIVVAMLSAVYVIGLASKAALFGEPRATLAMKLFERIRKETKQTKADITHTTHHNSED